VRAMMALQGIGRVEIEELTQGAPSYTAPRAVPPVLTVASVPAEGKLDDLKARVRLGQTGADMHGAARSVTPMAVPQFALAGLLNRKFADATTRATFLPKLAGSLGTVRQRLTLFRDLGQRYPPAAGRLSKEERALFKQLVGLEYRELCRELDELRASISVLAGVDDVVHPANRPPAGLVSRAPEALSRASSLDHEVRLLLTHKDLTPSEDERSARRSWPSGKPYTVRDRNGHNTERRAAPSPHDRLPRPRASREIDPPNPPNG
jgi:hypothetical protein